MAAAGEVRRWVGCGGRGGGNGGGVEMDATFYVGTVANDADLLGLDDGPRLERLCSHTSPLTLTWFDLWGL